MICFSQIQKTFKDKTILKNFSVDIHHGELICLIGQSGVGKTTVFDLLIGKEKPDFGDISIDGISLLDLSQSHLQFFRRKLGVIFQDFQLLKNKTIYENLRFVLEACGEDEKVIFSQIQKALQIVGLEEKISSFPAELSGGERQRVAIARALVHDPKIILADEPTGNLDPENTKIILDILKTVNKELGVTVLLTTHDPSVIEYLQTRTLYLKDGELVFDKVVKNYSEVQV